MGGKWYCSYPVLKECHDPAMLPVDEVRIDPVKINNIGLGKSIYTREQLEEFARFQDSQGTRKAYLAETAEMAYTGRNEKGEWGLALSSATQGSLIDIVGASFFPLYRVVGPMIFFLSLLLLVWGGLRLIITVLLRVIIIVRCKGCGIWVLTAFLGDPLPAGDLALQLGGRGDGRRGSEGRPDEGDRGRPRARGGGGEEKEHEYGGLEEKYSWWPSGHAKEGSTDPLQSVGTEAEENAALKPGKTTRL